MAPQDSQICGGNFPKRKKSVAELCQILRMVTIEIVIKLHPRNGHSLCDYILPALLCLRGDAFGFQFALHSVPCWQAHATHTYIHKTELKLPLK